MKIFATAKVHRERSGVTKVCMLFFKMTQTCRVVKETQGNLSLQRFVFEKVNSSFAKHLLCFEDLQREHNPCREFKEIKTEQSTIPESCAVVNSRLLLGSRSRFDFSCISKSAIRVHFVFAFPWEPPAFKRKIKSTRGNFSRYQR